MRKARKKFDLGTLETILFLPPDMAIRPTTSGGKSIISFPSKSVGSSFANSEKGLIINNRKAAPVSWRIQIITTFQTPSLKWHPMGLNFSMRLAKWRYPRAQFLGFHGQSDFRNARRNNRWARIYQPTVLKLHPNLEQTCGSNYTPSHIRPDFVAFCHIQAPRSWTSAQGNLFRAALFIHKRRVKGKGFFWSLCSLIAA